MIRFATALAVALALAACGSPPAPPPPDPPLVVPTPGPVLRDTLPTVEPRAHVPLPRGRPKPRRKPVTKPSPTAPYPCAVVLLYLRSYSTEDLERMARERGITEDQRKAAMACTEHK